MKVCDKLSVVIAEDKKEDIVLIRKSFSRLNRYKISYVAIGGRDLIMHLCDVKTLPDLIIMDMQMPCCDGLLATIICKRLFNNIKIIGLSTHTNASVINEFMTEGGSGFLSKFILYSDSAISRMTYNNDKILENILDKIIIDNQVYFDPLCQYSNDDYTKLNSTKKIIEWEFSHLKSIYITYLQLNAAGFTKEEISKILYLSTVTIKRLNFTLCSLFGAKSHKDLVNFSFMFGIAKTIHLYQKYGH